MGMMVRRNMKQRAVVKAAPILVEEKTENEVVEMTKTDINRMSAANLRKLAKEHGIEDAEYMTGVELKKTLISKLEV